MKNKILIPIIILFVLGGGFFIWHQYFRPVEEVQVPNDEVVNLEEDEEVTYPLIDKKMDLFVAPFDPGAIMIDPRTGAEIVSNQVIVEFKGNVSRTTIEAVITELGCIIIGEITIFGHTRFQLKIPEGASPIDLVAQFEKSPYIKWAGVNPIARPEGLY